MIPIKTLEDSAFNEAHYVFMCTRNGTVKKTSLTQFASPRKGGIIAIELQPNDELIAVLLTDGKRQVVIATEQGMAIRFEESDVRSMGRGAYGVKGIALEKGDEVVSAESLPPVAEGKRVRVAFRDGRQVAGFSPDYREGGSGFFMIPADTRTNTGRIWVYRDAVRQISLG